MQNKDYIYELALKISELIEKMSELEKTKGKKDMQSLRNTSHQLKERAIELDLLYTIEALAGKEELSVVEILQETVYRIPGVCKIGAQPCARIIFKELVLRSPRFKETSKKLSSSLNIGNVQVGLIEACFPEKTTLEGHQKTSKQLFLDSLAMLLGNIIEGRN